jgi:hypothetical protein
MVEVGTSMAVAPRAGAACCATDGERERHGRLPDVQIEEWAGDGHLSTSSIPNGSRPGSARRRALRPGGLTVASAGAGLASTAITAQRDPHFSSGSQLGKAGAPGDSLNHFVGV